MFLSSGAAFGLPFLSYSCFEMQATEKNPQTGKQDNGSPRQLDSNVNLGSEEKIYRIKMNSFALISTCPRSAQAR